MTYLTALSADQSVSEYPICLVSPEVWINNNNTQTNNKIYIIMLFNIKYQNLPDIQQILRLQVIAQEAEHPLGQISWCEQVMGLIIHRKLTLYTIMRKIYVKLTLLVHDA